MADTKGDRDEAQRRVVEALAQHSSYLYRASTATSNRIRKIIDEAGQSLSTELLERLDNLTQAELTALSRGKYTTSRLKGVQNAIEAWAEKLDERIKEAFSEDGEALAGQEVRYTEELMGSVLVDAAAVSLTASEVYSRSLAEPVLGQFVEDMLSEVTERTRQQVYSTVRQGIAAGSTNAEIIRALRGTKALQFKDGILQTARTAAERVVRTGRNHISNVAYEDTYQALGVTELVWTSTLDGRVSKVCASRDGERYAVGSNHPRPPAHPNCLVGDSLVTSAGGVTNASKRWFDGEVVVIRTASGRELTCTPNHPILTGAGWIAAKDVQQVGNVISYGAGKWEGLVDGNHQHVIPTIHEVAEALFRSAKMAPVPVPVTPEHFHGDGAGSHVAVVGADGLLRNERMAALLKHAAKLDFVLRAATPSSGFPELGPLALGLKRVHLSASGFVGLADKVGNLLWGAGTHASCLLLSTAPHFAPRTLDSQLSGALRVSEPVNNTLMAHAGIKQFANGVLHHVRDESPIPAFRGEAFGLEDAGYSLVGDAELERRILDGESLEGVFVDHVVDHVVRPFSGHVYNLETETGYYYANGIITHNCRSVLSPSFDDDIMGQRPYVRAFKPVSKIPQSQRPDDMIGQVSAKTTYADWFKRQPTGFQREWLGDKRYKLYREGNYKLDRFVDPLGKEYSLAELETRDRETFRQLFDAA